MDPELLVAKGWQKSVSIDGAYAIVFPELFRDSKVSKTDTELTFAFSCAENQDIEFKIIYTMQQNLEHFVYEILATNGVILEEQPENHRVTCLWQVGDTVYRSIFTEVQYSQSLLGTSFGEEEWITGVMQVMFSYPAERREVYEAEQYCFYVTADGEE